MTSRTTLRKIALVLTALAVVGASAPFVLAATAQGTTGTATAGAPVAFGMDSASVAAQKAAGAAPDYGTFWIGPWTLTSGWGGPDAQMASLKAAGVTPAIHFYYWGDDITPSCVENGCWSSLHNAQKDRAHWDLLEQQLAAHMGTQMGGKPVVVFLESEFNKGGISTYEPFDGYLADMAAKIHQGYPNAVVVLGFGNWDSGNWKTFDRAAAASDMVGIQGMRGSTRQSLADMMTLYDGLVAGVKTLGTTFPGKAIMLTDIAVSSYPEPTYLQVQADSLGEVMANLATLKSLGVKAIVYRSWNDSPTMDLANYYGMAERYWGLAGKPAATVWTNAVKAERASASAPVTPPPAPSTSAAPSPSAPLSSPVPTTAVPTATPTAPVANAFGFTAKTASGANAWWVDASVAPQAGVTVTKVEAKAGSGAWQTLAKTSWGTWAKSFNAPAGTAMSFRATATDGRTATTPTMVWLKDTQAVATASGQATSPATPSATTTAPPATTATGSATYSPAFTPKAVGNDWWVETAVGTVSGKAPAKVEAKVGSGAWTALPKDTWGTYAKSLAAPNGSPVQFRATSDTGQVAYSKLVTWT